MIYTQNIWFSAAFCYFSALSTLPVPIPDEEEKLTEAPQRSLKIKTN